MTCLNVLPPKTTRSKSVGNQVGFILDTVREITEHQGWWCPCKVLEHIQPGVPKIWGWTGTSYQISANIRLEIKCTINILCLKHPETIPPIPGPWKIVFHEISSCCQNVEDPWYTPCGLWFWEASMQDWLTLDWVLSGSGDNSRTGHLMSLCCREGRLERGHSGDWEEAVVSGSAQGEFWYMVRAQGCLVGLSSCGMPSCSGFVSLCHALRCPCLMLISCETTHVQQENNTDAWWAPAQLEDHNVRPSVWAECDLSSVYKCKGLLIPCNFWKHYLPAYNRIEKILKHIQK